MAKPAIFPDKCTHARSTRSPKQRLKKIFHDGKQNEVQRRDFPDIDVNEDPDKDADVSAGKKYEKKPGYGGDRAACPQRRRIGREHLSASGKNSASQIKCEITDVPSFSLRLFPKT